MRALTGLAAAAVMATAMVMAPPASTATTAITTSAATGSLVSLTADAGPHVAIGMTTTTRVTVTAVIDEPRGPVTYVLATLGRTTRGPVTWVDLVLAEQSVTGSVGTYVGSVVLGSTAGGTWRATSVLWTYRAAGGVAPVVVVDPRGSVPTDLRVLVDGRDAPRVTSVRIPTWVPYGARQWVQYTYRSASGKPIVGWPVAYGSGGLCAGDEDPTASYWPTKHLTTDAHGRITVRAYLTTITCLRLATAVDAQPAGQAGLGSLWPSTYMAFRTVTIHVSTNRVRAGRAYYVTGRVYPVRGMVAVQQWTGRRWTTIATGYPDPTGSARTLGMFRIRVVAAQGRHAIRVMAYKGGMKATVSRVLAVTGTRS